MFDCNPKTNASSETRERDSPPSRKVRRRSAKQRWPASAPTFLQHHIGLRIAYQISARLFYAEEKRLQQWKSDGGDKSARCQARFQEWTRIWKPTGTTFTPVLLSMRATRCRASFPDHCAPRRGECFARNSPGNRQSSVVSRRACGRICAKTEYRDDGGERRRRGGAARWSKRSKSRSPKPFSKSSTAKAAIALSRLSSSLVPAISRPAEIVKIICENSKRYASQPPIWSKST